MSKKILVVDDNLDLQSNLLDFFEIQGYQVDGASDGLKALQLLRTDSYDLVVLDVGLPGMDGLTLSRTLRAERMSVPILMLSARKAVDDRVMGLEAGADDYLVKPFSLKELSARVEALLRRAQHMQTTLQVGDLSLDLAHQRAVRAGEVLKLTPIAMKLLAALMRRSPDVVKRSELEASVWGEAVPNSDSLRANLYLLRQVVDKPFDRPLIHTHAGRGWSIGERQEQRR